MKILFQVFVLLLSLLALKGVGGLSLTEWKTGTACPKVIGIPVCYIITIAVILLLLSQIPNIKYEKWMFGIGAGLPFAIALFASALQFNDIIQCPKTTGGTPMCYLSLGLFSMILLLKVVMVICEKYNVI